MELLVGPAKSLPPDLGDLVAASQREGFGAVVKLRDAWQAGGNRFDNRGEALFAARRDGVLVGVCGLNADPYCDDRRVGRVRHLYVHPATRRHGVATALVTAVVGHAAGYFDVLRLRTDREDANAFYLARGFTAVEGDLECTHRLQMTTGSGR